LVWIIMLLSSPQDAASPSSKGRGLAHRDGRNLFNCWFRQGEKANPFSGDLYWLPVSYTEKQDAGKSPFMTR
jgi:hypothetical protein